MKCALVIPAWIPEEIFPAKTVSSQVNYWQPLGTLYVAACLLKAGHEVSFLNGAFLTHGRILRRLLQFKPDVVGIYSTAFGWPKAVDTATDIKRDNPEIFVCVGGPYPIALQERCLGGGARGIDAVVTGEGESTMVEMLDRLQRGESLEGVRGVVFRQGVDIIRNPPRPLIEDLDALPFPARELLGCLDQYVPAPATYRRTPVAVVLTSRGCNRKCIFCYQIDKERKSGVRGVRYRSVDNVMQEIECCLAQGYREIKFIDDSFAADYGRAMELTQEIRIRGLDFTWFASACVNQVDKSLLRAMKEAGCWAILLGAESGVQKNLNTLRKGSTLDQIRNAVCMAKDAGLEVSTPFMFGIPGETFEDGLKTIEFAIELDPDLANFHALTPFPGTHLYEHIGEYGSVTGDLTHYTYQGAAFVPYSMSRKEIQSLRRIAFRRFYSRPRFLFRRLFKMRNWNDCKMAARSIRSLFWLWMGGRLMERPKSEATSRSSS